MDDFDAARMVEITKEEQLLQAVERIIKQGEKQISVARDVVNLYKQTELFPITEQEKFGLLWARLRDARCFDTDIDGGLPF